MPQIDASTETAVANEALSHIRVPAIVDIDADQSNTAMVLRKHFASVRDTSIRRYPWNFASRRAKLSKLVDAPAFGFCYQYGLPTDPWCLRVLEVNECDGKDGEWKVEGRLILTDYCSPIRVRYLARETAVANWDAQFRTAFAFALASACAPELAKDGAITESMSEQAQAAFLDAFPSDAIEGTADEVPESDVLRARR